MWSVAAVQMASGPAVEANLAEVDTLIMQAVEAGADLVVLPEFFALMGFQDTDTLKIAEKDGSGPIQDFLSRKAHDYGVWLVGGTIPVRASRMSGRVRAASLLFDSHGERVARYDKIHLFDVVVEGDSRSHYTESKIIEPGDQVVVAETPGGRLGLAVCYDLRFPELFRAMAGQGVDIISLPSAFTAITGRAHWEILLRARAIENLSYVIAPAQGGYHRNGRETWGDTMIVDPWGSVLNRIPKGSGCIVQSIDTEKTKALRTTFPALQHIRFNCHTS